MSKKYLTLIFTGVAILISTLLWDKILLPYDTQNQIYGEYSVNQYNPNNDTLRFLLFISLPLLVFLISYLIFFKEKTFSINYVLFNKNIVEKNNKVNFVPIIILFTIALLIQLFTLDFSKFSQNIDYVHDGMLLTPSSNAYFLSKFWLSSYIERGLFAQFSPILLWSLFDIKSIGLVHISNIILLFLNKFLLVILCSKISQRLPLGKLIKKIYFIFLSILAISLVSYYDLGAFPERSFLFLLFFIIFESSFYNNKFYFPSFLLGLFSMISMLWFIDIGAYINVLLLIILIYFLLRKEIRKLSSILFGIIFGWFFFIIIVPTNEFNEFINITLSVYANVDYYNGLIYPTPFLSGNSRATRALLLIIVAGILTIFITFNKKYKLSHENRIFFIFLFLASILTFKTALSRSDTPHIKVAVGFNLFLIYSLALYIFSFLLERKEKMIFNINKFFNNFKKKYINLLIIFFLLNILILKNNIEDVKNLPDSLKNIKNLATYGNNKYLNNDYIELINYYKDLINDENCIQTLTNEAVLPYLMDKPVCTQFYFMYPVGHKNLQKKFIEQLETSKPKIILYNSKTTTWDFSSKHAKHLFDYINQNYSFHSRFKYWTFYKIN
tara:strand:+ start:73 stop:1908 length:1836 start_codon:yes stop_codon:yes gene_type:complete